MRTRSRDDFTTISTEGQILPPDLLTRIVERDSDLEGADPPPTTSQARPSTRP